MEIKPQVRKNLAAIHFWVSLVAGIICTIFIAKDPFEKVLMGISFYAITITAWDVWQTSDVRTQQEGSISSE